MRYKLEAQWDTDKVGNGIRLFFYRSNQLVQSSHHPNLSLVEAVQSALTNLFETALADLDKATKEQPK